MSLAASASAIGDAAISPGADLIDYRRFADTPLQRDPFDYLVVPGFVPPQVAVAAAETFPGPDLPGVLPAPAASPNDAFGRLLTALRSGATHRRCSPRNSAGRCRTDRLMVTLRARTRPIDGRIHNDSATKVITALIYLNDAWSGAGGRLRLLRGPHDIEDMIAEVPPLAGTLIAFAARKTHGMATSRMTGRAAPSC